MSPQALTALGYAERNLHHLDAALRYYEEALAIYRAEGDALHVAHTVRHVGDIQRQAGRLQLAEPCYMEALDIYRRHEQTPPLDLANAIRGLALLKSTTSDTQQARALWAEARNLYAALDIKEGVAESDRHISLPTHPDGR